MLNSQITPVKTSPRVIYEFNPGSRRVNFSEQRELGAGAGAAGGHSGADTGSAGGILRFAAVVAVGSRTTWMVFCVIVTQFTIHVGGKAPLPPR
jgi:hypothetical protein